MTQEEEDNRSVRWLVALLVAILVGCLLTQLFPMLSKQETASLDRLSEMYAEVPCICAEDLNEIRSRMQDPRTTQLPRMHRHNAKRDDHRASLNFSVISRAFLHMRYALRDDRFIDLVDLDWKCTFRQSRAEIHAQLKECRGEQFATKR